MAYARNKTTHHRDCDTVTVCGVILETRTPKLRLFRSIATQKITFLSNRRCGSRKDNFLCRPAEVRN